MPLQHIPRRPRTAGADAGHHASRAHGSGPDADLDDVRACGDQISGSLCGDHVACNQRDAEIERLEGGERIDHSLLVTVSRVHDDHVCTGVDECLGLGAHVTVHTDRRSDPECATLVDCGVVDAGTNRAGAGEDAGKSPVFVDDDRQRIMLGFEQFEDLTRCGGDRGRDEVGDRDGTEASEPIDIRAAASVTTPRGLPSSTTTTAP